MEDQDMQRCEAPANPWFSVKLSKLLESKVAQPDSLLKCTLGICVFCLPAKPLGEKIAAIQCC